MTYVPDRLHVDDYCLGWGMMVLEYTFFRTQRRRPVPVVLRRSCAIHMRV